MWKITKYYWMSPRCYGRIQSSEVPENKGRLVKPQKLGLIVTVENVHRAFFKMFFKCLNRSVQNLPVTRFLRIERVKYIRKHRIFIRHFEDDFDVPF